MKIITTRTFRANLKTYLELAKTEKVIVHRNDTDSVLISPINEDVAFFSDDEILKDIKAGLDDIKQGRLTVIKDANNIWENIL